MAKVTCTCCGRRISESRARIHRKGKGGVRCNTERFKRERSCEQAAPARAQSPSSHTPPCDSNPTHPAASQPPPAESNPPPLKCDDDWVEHLEPDDDLSGSDDPLSEDELLSDSEWDDEEDREELKAEEVAQILEEWHHEAFTIEDHVNFRHILTEQDRDNIKMFALRLSFKLTRRFHDQFRSAFADKIHMHSLYVMHRRIAIISGIMPVLYDCCPASCCAYTGEHEQKDACPYCECPRFSPDGEPLATFEYLPVIPRLQAIFENPESMARLRYRTERETSLNAISDIFDGSLYKSLSGRQVVVDGVEYEHAYFDDWRNIPTALLGDGFQLFKRSRRGHSSAWPFILLNYGLEPEIRTHIENVMPVCIIGGPTTPKDFSSFLYPFAQESKRLAIGVPTFDAASLSIFTLRSYNLTNIGDMIAIRYTQCMKGPNGYSPCRICSIRGIRDVKGDKKTYYVPLRPPKGNPAKGRQWDPRHLPMRTDEEIVEQLAQIRAAPTQTARARKAMLYGINGESVLFQIPSMSPTMSFPYDGMHLIFENHVPNMVKLWKGIYAGLDEGTEEYEIALSVWKQIGKETVAATSTIPSAFVSALPNIYEDTKLYTAEMWSFWIVYIAPHVLKNRFKRPKYYEHMLELVDIIKTILQFTISRQEIEQLRTKIIHYVETFEKFYYQYRRERLTACRITVHALLHLPDDIERTGPIWTNWAFVMERFCGLLLPAVKSKRKPYACLNRRIIHIAQLVQITQRFDLGDMLRFQPPRDPISRHEVAMDACPELILRWPKQLQFVPDKSVLSKVVAYFRTMFNCPAETIKQILPEQYERWGSMRIVDGDVIRGKAALPRDSRDNSFMKYTLLVDKNARHHRRAPEYEQQIFYGQLDFILVCNLPASRALQVDQPTTHVLALVQTCKTSPEGGNAAQEVVSYTDLHPAIFINLNAIQCGVGRVRVSGTRWGIVDRTGDYVRTTFEDLEDNEAV